MSGLYYCSGVDERQAVLAHIMLTVGSLKLSYILSLFKLI
jgi:hypothetical protein